MSTLQATLQSLEPGARVSLYRIDTTPVGGGVMYFTTAGYGGPVSFGGIVYQPVDIEVDGFEVNAGGSLPTPNIRIANTDLMVQALINTYGDMLGCKVQRIRTFAQYLDGQPEADPTAYLGPDTFEIERKTEENDVYVEWQLSASIDQEGKDLPGRTVIRDTCMWRYRHWNAAAGRFEYGKAQCPYAGNGCFDRSGVVVSPDKDECGRRLSDCELRFGNNQPLPIGAFPGTARIRA
jgi:lambda family phage minor tail protein L